MPAPLLTAAGRPVKSYPAPPGWGQRASSSAERIRAYAHRFNWTPTDLPDLRTFRQSPQARRLATRAMLSDESVKTGLFQKVRGVAQLDLQAAPAEETESGDKVAANFCRYAITEALPGGVPQLVENIALPALLNGESLCEPVWPQPGKLVERGKWKGRRVLASIKSRPPDSYQFITDDHSNVVSVRYQSSNGQVDADPATFLIFTDFSLYSSPFGISDLEAAYNWYTVKCAAILMRQVFLDRVAGGWIIATSSNPQDPLLKADLAAARDCGFVILPTGSTAQVLDIAGGSDDKFRNGIEDCDKHILIAITGAYLQVVEGTNPDARGNSQVHKTGSELLQWHLATKISSVLTHQLGPILVDENFVGVGYPRLSLSMLDPGFAKAELENGLLLQAGGAGLDPDEWYRKGGWSPPKDPAKALYGIGRGPAVPGANGAAPVNGSVNGTANGVTAGTAPPNTAANGAGGVLSVR
jgi:hypothetical protein